MRATQVVSRTLSRNVRGALEAVGITWLDAVVSERVCPFTYRPIDMVGDPLECRPGVLSECGGLGLIDGHEFAPCHRPGCRAVLVVHEQDVTGAVGVVEGDDVADVVAVQCPHSSADLGVRPECHGLVEAGTQLSGVGVALACGDVLGVSRPLCQVEQRGDGNLGGEIADVCRLGVPRRDELLCARGVGAFDQFVLGGLGAFAG